MNRLRTLARDYLLPLVIGALVLRALIPVGFMPGGSAGFSLTATLCEVPGAVTPGTETIKVPGVGMPADTHTAHCDYCVVPLMGTAFVLPALPPAAAIGFEPRRAHANAPASRFALERAQIPRAPPLA